MNQKEPGAAEGVLAIQKAAYAGAGGGTEAAFAQSDECAAAPSGQPGIPGYPGCLSA